MNITRSASGWVATLSLAALSLAAPLGAQNLVTNGGFETGNFSGWAQTGDVSFTTVNNTCAHSGTYCARLGPVGEQGYLLQQLLTTQAGHTYDVSFWLQHLSSAIAPEASFNAYWNGALFYASAGGMFSYVENSALLVALFPGTQLAFEFREDPSYWHLDDISVVDLGVVPEPASFVLLGTGLVGLMALARRRRNNA